MFFFIKHLIKIIILPFLIIFTGCQLQEQSNNHGILFLENRANKLILNKTNINDTIKILGEPHTKSIENDKTWYYLERTLTKGKYHKLGKNVLKSNNLLILNLNKYGILEKKEFLDKSKKNEMIFTKKTTENQTSQTSFIAEFLSSVREKMYSGK